MTNHSFASLILLIALVSAACGPSMTTEEATAQCDRLAADLISCIDEDARLQCIACYEDCGRDCQLGDATCPHTFTCE